MFSLEMLNSCPFCGAGEDKLETLKMNTGDYYYVRCSVCHARGGCAETERNAHILWNLRYLPPMHCFPVIRVGEEELDGKSEEYLEELKNQRKDMEQGYE